MTRERRQRSNYKHPPPPDVRKQRPIDQRRHKIPHDIPFLQQSREKSTPLRRQSFERQCRAHAPLPAHCNPKEHAHNQKHFQRWCERRRQLKHRIRNNVHHQSRTPPKPVCHHPEQNRSHRPHGQRQKNCLRNRRNLCLKLRSQRADAKNQNEKIKRIQRPPQKAGNKRIPLYRSKSPKVPNEFHTGWFAPVRKTHS